MNLKYRLNLRIFEYCVVLSTVAKWHGILNLKDELNQMFPDMNITTLEFTNYAVDVITDGTNPILVDFLLKEELKDIETQYPDNFELLAEIRLMMLLIQQIQLGNRDELLQVLLNSIDDITLRSQYRHWAYINEYNYKITFEESKELTTEENLKIMDSNKVVKQYYDGMFKNNK